MNDLEHVRRAAAAKAIIESPLWAEAWESYRMRLLEIIEAADSAHPEAVMQAKRLLTAGKSARGYLERLIVDGKVSAETIKIQEAQAEAKRRWWQRSA